MFKNLKIGTRMALGFLIVILFMIAIIHTNLNQISVCKEKFHRIVQINNVRLELANDLINDARETEVNIKGLLLAKYSKSKEGQKEHYNKYQKFSKKVKEYAPKIKSLITKTDNEGFAQLKKMEEYRVIAQALQDRVVELAMEEKLSEATHIAHEQLSHAIEEWILNIHKTIDHNIERNDRRYAQAMDVCRSATITMWTLGISEIVISVIIILFLTLSITKPLAFTSSAADRVASGDLDVDLTENEKRGDELGFLTRAFSKMVVALRKNRDEEQKQDWLKTGIAQLNKVVAGDLDISKLSKKVISEISVYIDAKVGAIYIADTIEGKTFSLCGSYAYKKSKDLPGKYKLGEGLVGQAAKEKHQLVIKNVPENYIRITSGLGEKLPKCICVIPIIREGNVKGIIEVGMLTEITEFQQEYLEQATAVIAVAVESAESRTKLSETLEESQTLAEELQAQQEELKASNEELEEQRQQLQQSEEELRVSNEELEEKAADFDRKKGV